MNLNSMMRKKHFPTLVIVAAIWLLLVIAKSMDTPGPLPWEVAASAPSSIAPSIAITAAASTTVTAQVAVTTTQAAQEQATGWQVAAQTATGDPEKGKKLFASTCAACHGPNGQGVKGLGKDMTTSTFIAGLSDPDLLAFVKKGRAPGEPLNTTGVLMPPKGGNPALKDEQLLDIIAFIRTIHTGAAVDAQTTTSTTIAVQATTSITGLTQVATSAAAPTQAATATTAPTQAPTPTPVATQASTPTLVAAEPAAPPLQASKGNPENGKKLFASTCAACHSPEGKGVKGLGKDMTTSKFIAGLTDDELLAFVKRGRDMSDPLNTTGVAMPPKGGNPALNDEKLLDIIAFIRTIHKQ